MYRIKFRYGHTALVTGASSGIGASFARALAREGCNLILVARRGDRLAELEQEIYVKNKISILSIVADLSVESECKRVFEEVAREGKSVDLLVNNAGFGLQGEFLEIAPERQLGMIDLNCKAVVQLAQLFLPGMVSRKRGAMIITSSVIGSVPAPWFATYAATKAFDLYWGEALHGEMQGKGVDILTVLPGLTKTEFQSQSGMREYHSPYRSADQVVETALTALGRKAIVVDGWHNKILVHGIRILPRAMALGLSRMVMKFETKH